jgi:hypothetical protein
MRITKLFVLLVMFACLFSGMYASAVAENPRVESTLPSDWVVYASVMPMEGGSNLNTQLVLESLLPRKMTILEVRFSKPGAEKWTPTSVAMGRSSSTRWIWGSKLHGYVDVSVTVAFAGKTGDIIVRGIRLDRNQALTIGSDFPPEPVLVSSK